MKPGVKPAFDGHRLKALRRQRGWRAEDVARAAGVSARHIWRLEANARPHVAAVTLARIALALGTSVDYVLGLTDDARGPGREGAGNGAASARR